MVPAVGVVGVLGSGGGQDAAGADAPVSYERGTPAFGGIPVSDAPVFGGVGGRSAAVPERDATGYEVLGGGVGGSARPADADATAGPTNGSKNGSPNGSKNGVAQPPSCLHPLEADAQAGAAQVTSHATSGATGYEPAQLADAPAAAGSTNGSNNGSANGSKNGASAPRTDGSAAPAAREVEPRQSHQQCDVNFIVCKGIIKGKGLQALVQIVYQILDQTRNVV